MVNKLKIFQHQRADDRDKLLLTRKGITLIEVLVGIGIIAILAVVFYPSIMNSLETRKLENKAREVLTTLHVAKSQAVKTKIKHRVRFLNENNRWFFFIEREDNPTQWNGIPGFIRKTISSEFDVSVNFPSQTVEFSPLGFILNFSASQNSITLQSDKLESFDQPDLRIIKVSAGGSVQYIKSQQE